jgi:hypothetical protein
MSLGWVRLMLVGETCVLSCWTDRIGSLPPLPSIVFGLALPVCDRSIAASRPCRGACCRRGTWRS